MNSFSGRLFCRTEMESGKLFIGGISWDTNEDRLRDHFQAYGEVSEAVIMKDRATGRARGFGFVLFSDPAVAERVVLDKHIIDGRTVSLASCIRISVLIGFSSSIFFIHCGSCHKQRTITDDLLVKFSLLVT